MRHSSPKFLYFHTHQLFTVSRIGLVEPLEADFFVEPDCGSVIWSYTQNDFRYISILMDKLDDHTHHFCPKTFTLYIASQHQTVEPDVFFF